MSTRSVLPLVGRWKKLPGEGGTSWYPDTLEFRADGTYRGAGPEPGSFVLWDAGAYQPTGSSEVRIATANDAVVTYRYTLAGDNLEFEDSSGCRMLYRRIPN